MPNSSKNLPKRIPKPYQFTVLASTKRLPDDAQRLPDDAQRLPDDTRRLPDDFKSNGFYSIWRALMT